MFSGMQLNDDQPGLGASPAAATPPDARGEAGGPAPPLTASCGSSFSFMNGGAVEAAPSATPGLAALGGMPGAAVSPFAFMSKPDPSLAAPAAPAVAPAAPGPAGAASAMASVASKSAPAVRKKTSKARKPGWAADGTALDGTAPPDGAVPPPAAAPSQAAAAAPPRSTLQLEHRSSGELLGLVPGHDELVSPRRHAAAPGVGGEGGGSSSFAGFSPPAAPGASPSPSPSP